MNNTPTTAADDPAVSPTVDDRLTALIAGYGDGAHGNAPTPTQWRRILDHPAGAPITLINLFKLRSIAHYPSEHLLANTPGTGQEALARYTEVSIPTAQRVGARFLLLGPAAGSFLGPEEDWDLIAIGTYPNAEAVLALYQDDSYRQAYTHRTAACERQRVLLCAN